MISLLHEINEWLEIENIFFMPAKGKRQNLLHIQLNQYKGKDSSTSISSHEDASPDRYASLPLLNNSG